MLNIELEKFDVAKEFFEKAYQIDNEIYGDFHEFTGQDLN